MKRNQIVNYPLHQWSYPCREQLLDQLELDVLMQLEFQLRDKLQSQLLRELLYQLCVELRGYK